MVKESYTKNVQSLAKYISIKVGGARMYDVGLAVNEEIPIL